MRKVELDFISDYVRLLTEKIPYKEWKDGLSYQATFDRSGSIQFLQNGKIIYLIEDQPNLWLLLDIAAKLRPNIQRYFQEKDETRKGELRVLIEKQLEFFLKEEENFRGV